MRRRRCARPQCAPGADFRIAIHCGHSSPIRRKGVLARARWAFGRGASEDRARRHSRQRCRRTQCGPDQTRASLESPTRADGLRDLQARLAHRRPHGRQQWRMQPRPRRSCARRARSGVCFTGVCGGIAENDRCGSADIAGVDEGETVAPHRSYKPSFAPNRIWGAQQILHIEVRLKEGPVCWTFSNFFVACVVLAH